MRHRTESSSAKQIPLPFNPAAVCPDSKSVLHAAYTRLQLSRRLSFEQVMSNHTYAIGVRNLADAMARRSASAKRMKEQALTRLRQT